MDLRQRSFAAIGLSRALASMRNVRPSRKRNPSASARGSQRTSGFFFYSLKNDLNTAKVGSIIRGRCKLLKAMVDQSLSRISRASQNFLYTDRSSFRGCDALAFFSLDKARWDARHEPLDLLCDSRNQTLMHGKVCVANQSSDE